MKKILLCLLALCSWPVFAALPAGGIINIRSTATAANLNGGGFNAARGGTNYTLQDAAQLTGTDGSATGTTTFTSVSGGFTTAMEGNYIHLTASTGLTVGWYEIVTRTDTNNVVLDRTPGTGTATTYYVGGAMSLNSTLDDDLFEIGVAGNIFYIKGAVTYTLGEAVSIAAAGGAQAPIMIKGYTTTQGDACTGSNRPTIAAAANGLVLGANWDGDSFIITGTTSPTLAMGANSKLTNIKGVNSSTTAARAALRGSTDYYVFNCEAVSYRGPAFAANGNSGSVVGSWLHDSDVGYSDSGTTTVNSVLNCIIESSVTAAVQISGAHTARVVIAGNTLFGSTNTTGIGVSIATGSTDIALLNNIISGFVTGVSHADTQTVGYDNWNDYHNNDTDVTNWTKGANDSAVAPSFTSAGQVTGTNATISSSTLTSSGADFTAAGVVAGRDYVYLVSGTAGPTFGIYGITAVGTTTLTLDIAPGNSATADHVYQITIGHNFGVGSAMKALGFPGAFQGGYSTGYMDQGAVQRIEPSTTTQSYIF